MSVFGLVCLVGKGQARSSGSLRLLGKDWQGAGKEGVSDIALGLPLLSVLTWFSLYIENLTIIMLPVFSFGPPIVFSHHFWCQPFLATWRETKERGLLVPSLHFKGGTECSKDPGIEMAVEIKMWYFQKTCNYGKDLDLVIEMEKETHLSSHFFHPEEPLSRKSLSSHYA